MIETLITIITLGICIGALIVSIGNKNKIGCQRPDCKCEN